MRVSLEPSCHAGRPYNILVDDKIAGEVELEVVEFIKSASHRIKQKVYSDFIENVRKILSTNEEDCLSKVHDLLKKLENEIVIHKENT